MAEQYIQYTEQDAIILGTLFDRQHKELEVLHPELDASVRRGMACINVVNLILEEIVRQPSEDEEDEE